MSMNERHNNALSYIAKCERRRQRLALRRYRKFSRFARVAIPAACGFSVFATFMALL